jgi:energy-coupling factor transport system substrate-specific component
MARRGRAQPAQIGRWPLALACFVIGYAFTVLQDFGDWVTYSDHSLAQLGVYVGKGAGFDLVHAVGCLLFALAFGPALMRSLQRFRLRLQVSWRSLDAAVAPALTAALILGGAFGLTAAPRARASGTPLGYLLGAQNADGGYGAAPGSGSTSLFAGWSALALAAQGRNPIDVVRGGHTLAGYLGATLASATDPGSLERTILAVRAAGLPASDFGGRDLLAGLRRDIRGDGSVSEQTNLTAFAVLALRSAAAGPGARTISWLARQQDSDGGFNFATAPGSSDVDDTGAVLEALAGAGRGHTIARAVAFLRARQNRNGGFPSSPGGDSNAQSTAFAVQGLIAAGVNPAGLHRGGAPSPVQYLTSLIAPDGHVLYAAGNDQTPVWVTAQVAMALAGKPLPIAPAARAAGAGAGQPATQAPRRSSAKSPARVTTSKSTDRRHAHRRRSRPGGKPRGSSSDWLPIGAGLLTALALAPLGS